MATKTSQAPSFSLIQNVFKGDEAAELFLSLVSSPKAKAADSYRLLGLVAAKQEFLTRERAGDALQDYLLERLLDDPNPFHLKAERVPQNGIGPALLEAYARDLVLFRALLLKPLGGDTPDFSGLKGMPAPATVGTSVVERLEIKRDLLEPKASDWALALRVADYLYKNGVGVFAHHRVFRWEPGRERLVGVTESDPVKLADLKGYDLQRRVFLDNVEAFTAGKTANNVLIYGERGTGKSSTVKAALNEYADKGLRLVELSTRDALDAPVVIRLLRSRRERFMLFLDDLSFDADDERYRGLKALLEGSVEAPPDNVILVATSNRRHLMPESFSDRTASGEDAEVRSWDAVEEKLSLSDRFGLVVSFYQPDQDTYLAIVRHLAEKAGLSVSREALEAGSLKWALENNGRSGRTAMQYVKHLNGGSKND